ncbi:MAG: hypothetical protein AAFO70_04925 [Pseudomonadota bacterium]
MRMKRAFIKLAKAASSNWAPYSGVIVIGAAAFVAASPAIATMMTQNALSALERMVLLNASTAAVIAAYIANSSFRTSSISGDLEDLNAANSTLTVDVRALT